MIYTYNKAHVGDVLMVIVADDHGQALDYERQGNVARVYREDNQETVGWNIFDVSQLVALDGVGQVFPSDVAIERLNQTLEEAGFVEKLEPDHGPHFVVGEIVAMEAHPDSDHLNICQVAVGSDCTVQIVAGAPNAEVGLKTIVALPGSMMPSGSLIFPGKLRGVDSFGMMCSPRELHLPNAPQKRGIIELSNAVVGEAFDPQKHWEA